MKGNVDISVILCTYNRCESLGNVLNDLKNLNAPQNTAYEILVIDNNSTDGTRPIVEAICADNPEVFKYVFEPRQGKSFALNTGIRLARGETLAFTDDDVKLEANWLLAIKGAFEVHDCAGIGGKVIPVWPCEKPWWYEEEGPYALMAAIVKLDLGNKPCLLQKPAWGANLAFRRTMFDKYGFFREDLGPNPNDLTRGEDSEFCWRLIRGGEKFMYAPNVVVYHPVERYRMEQKYFESWYFNYGKVLIREDRRIAQMSSYFGVPRYLIRQLMKCTIQWVLCTSAKNRFYFKLQMWETAGAIAESRKRAT